jgi:hypothetical protein
MTSYYPERLIPGQVSVALSVVSIYCGFQTSSTAVLPHQVAASLGSCSYNGTLMPYCSDQASYKKQM